MYIQINLTTSGQNLYRVLTDAEWGRPSRYYLPMIYYFSEEAMPVTKEWQFYIMAINPGVDPKYLANLFGSTKAYANGDNGYGQGETKQNWFTGENTNSPYVPVMPKTFTGGDAIVEYQNGIVKLIDGNLSPNYDIMPWKNPELFFACVTTGKDGYSHPFPNGALYDWYKGGRTPVTFLPHVRRRGSINFPPPVNQWTDNTARLVKI